MEEGIHWLIIGLSIFMAGWTHVIYTVLTHNKKNKKKKQ